MKLGMPSIGDESREITSERERESERKKTAMR
jgi:hypothetical protein